MPTSKLLYNFLPANIITHNPIMIPRLNWVSEVSTAWHKSNPATKELRGLSADDGMVGGPGPAVGPEPGGPGRLQPQLPEELAVCEFERKKLCVCVCARMCVCVVHII